MTETITFPFATGIPRQGCFYLFLLPRKCNTRQGEISREAVSAEKELFVPGTRDSGNLEMKRKRYNCKNNCRLVCFLDS